MMIKDSDRIFAEMESSEDIRLVPFFEPGHSFIFTSPYEQYKDRIGQHAIVLAELDSESNSDKSEVGPMYNIEFDDGEIIAAWPEEIDPSLIESGVASS